MRIQMVCGRSVVLSVGDEVLLNWYGDAHVPRSLRNEWARVVGVTSRGSLLVRVDMMYEYDRRVIPRRHVRAVRSSVVSRV